MKFVVEQKELLAGLKAVARFAHPRCAHPMAAQCLIRVAAKGLVTLTVTDLDAWITMPIEAAAMTEGEYCCSLSLLHTLTRFISGPLTLSGDTGEVRVQAGTDVFTMGSLPACDFPREPLFEARTCTRITLPRLRQMYKAVAPAVASANDECRAVMCGVQLRVWPGSMSLAATDGRRFARVCSSTEQADEAEAILFGSKLKAVTQLQRGDELELTFGEHHVSLVGTGGLRMVSRTIEGRFPDYNKVIPAVNAYKSRFVFKKSDLVKAVRRALVFALERRSPDLIAWRVQHDGLAYESKTPGIGMATGLVPGRVEGELGLVVGLNGSYLLQGLSAIKEDTVVWSFQDETRSMLLEPAALTDFVSQEYLVMPVKLRDIADEYEARFAGQVAS